MIIVLYNIKFILYQKKVSIYNYVIISEKGSLSSQLYGYIVHLHFFL